MSIYATNKPTRELLYEEHICKRCGIEWKSERQNTYCIDCRHYAKRTT